MDSALNSLLPNVEWWKQSVIYSTYVDQFAGNFVAMAERLDYLSRLGVDCIHILPFYPSPFVDDGYDISNYCGVRPELGTIQDFQNFTEAAHNRGIRIMIDLVLNHTSTKHPWFIEASKSPTNPKRSYYLWSKTGNEYAAAANPFSELKSTNWIANPNGDDYYFSTFYPEQADLNWSNPELFGAMMNVIDFWTAKGVDGFRLDAAAHLIKKEGTGCVSLPETHLVLKRIRAYLDAHHPGVALLGEASGTDPISALKTYLGDGDECHLIYHFPLVGKLFLALKRNDPKILNDILEESANIPEGAQWVTLLRHHDEMPLAGLPADEHTEVFDHFDRDKKYKFNLGTSMRLATMFNGDQAAILRAYAMLFSIPGSPVIYYGDEIGMENLPVAPDDRDTRRSVRGKFSWENAQKQMNDPGSLFNGIAALVGDWKNSKNLSVRREMEIPSES